MEITIRPRMTGESGDGLEPGKLKQHGWAQHDIADALDVSAAAVSQWMHKAHGSGVHAARTYIAGASDQADACSETSHPGCALARGGGVWLSGRCLDVHPRRACYRVGIRGSLPQRPRFSLVEELGWTPQIPITRAVQRDEEAITSWRADVWPELRRRATGERRTLVFSDESGIYLLPGVVRTYGPKGQTPVVDKWSSRDHLSVMAGVTLAGKIYTLVRQKSLTSVHSVVFLKHLLCKTGKRLLMVWDGSPIHRWGEVREFLVGRGARRIHIEAMPGYAPDLSPLDQGFWHHLKHVELRNLACMDLRNCIWKPTWRSVGCGGSLS